jgi:hypothetical protein
MQQALPPSTNRRGVPIEVPELDHSVGVRSGWGYATSTRLPAAQRAYVNVG